jgi:hypothetical protein
MHFFERLDKIGSMKICTLKKKRDKIRKGNTTGKNGTYGRKGEDSRSAMVTMIDSKYMET